MAASARRRKGGGGGGGKKGQKGGRSSQAKTATAASKKSRSTNATERLEDVLNRLYYESDGSSSSGYGGVNALLKAAKSHYVDGAPGGGRKTVDRKAVVEFLSRQPTYTKFAPAKKTYARNHWSYDDVGQCMQMDLMIQTGENAKANGNYRYAMVAQDSWSRFSFSVPLKGRRSAEIVAGLTAILDTGYTPLRLAADKAGEHLAKTTVAWLTKRGIQHIWTNSMKHAPQAER